MSIEIRLAELGDLEEIFDIYNYEVENSTSTFSDISIKGQEMLDFFEKYDRKIYPIYVAAGTQNRKVVGWSRLKPYSKKAGYRITAEVSVFIHKDYRRLGLGQSLLQKLMDYCHKSNISVLIARISEDNQDSILLHERVGFEDVGILRKCGEKFGKLLDVRIMNYHFDKD